MYFDNKEQIINDYLNEVKKRIPMINASEFELVRQEAISKYSEKRIELYNSYLCETNVYSNTEFLQNILKEDIILNENGVFFKAPQDREEIPPTVECEIYLGNDRNEKKSLMKYYLDATKGNDPMKAQYNNRAQNNDKETMNTYYGTLQVRGGPFFNIDLAETITCRGRNMVAISALTVEGIFGRFKPNTIDGVLYYIQQNTIIPAKFMQIFKNPKNKDYTIDDVINKNFIDKIPCEYLDMVAHVLNNKSQAQLNYLMVKNNIDMWLELDEVNTAMCNFYQCLKDYNMAFLNPYLNPGDAKDDEFKREGIVRQIELLKEIKKLVPILNGFVWYQGAINRFNELINNPQDIIRDIDREFVALIDTDSNMIAMDLKYLYNKYLTHLTENEIDFTYTNTLAIIADSAVAESLYNWTTNLKVPEELKNRVAMKNEYYYSDFALTKRKKNYAGLMCLKEGVPFPKPKLDVKGLMFIKSVVNEETSKIIEDIVENDVLRSSKINITKILYKLNNAAEDLQRILTSEEGTSYYVPEKLNNVLTNTLPHLARTKSIELYNVLGIGDRILPPSNFHTIKIDIEQCEDDELIARYNLYKKVHTIHRHLRKYSDIDTTKFAKANIKKLQPGKNIVEVTQYVKDKFVELLKDMVNLNPDIELFTSSYKGSNYTPMKILSRDEICYILLERFNNDYDEIDEYLNSIEEFIINEGVKHETMVDIPFIKKRKWFQYKSSKNEDFVRLSIPDSMLVNPHPFILSTIDTVDEVTNIDGLSAPILANIQVSTVRNNKGKNLVSNIINIY